MRKKDTPVGKRFSNSYNFEVVSSEVFLEPCIASTKEKYFTRVS